MSFNNHLAFNVMKSNPTTSTTNTNTTSISQPTSNISDSGPASKSPLIQNILSRSAMLENSPPKSSSGPSTLGSSSPKFGTPSSASGSEATATIVTVSENLRSMNAADNKNDNRADLRGLFDKFDISSPKESDNEESDSIQGEKLYSQGELSSPNEDHKSKEKDKITDDKVEKNFVSSFGDTEKESQYREDEKEISHDSYNYEHKENAFGSNHGEQLENNPSLSEALDSHNGNCIRASELRPINSSHSGSPKSINEESAPQKTPEKREKYLSDITGSIDEQSSAVEEFRLSKDDFAQRGGAHEGETLSAGNASINKKAHKARANINPNDQYQESHKPFDFQHFLSHLREKSADPIVRYIRSFLVSFTRLGYTFTPEQKIKIIADFKLFMNDKFTMYEPFASMDDIDLENSREGLEKLIMNRLYVHCFPPELLKEFPSYILDSFAKDLEDDATFDLQLEKFKWLNGAHLDVNLKNMAGQGNGNLNFIEYAVNELNKINVFRAPRDKIICILNACKVIFSFLKVNDQETNADSFIPILILVILKARTKNLVSNMHYIENYRSDEWLSHGETSYYLSSLQGAIDFILNLTIDDLTIDEDEFKAHMEAWDEERKQMQAPPMPTEIRQPQPQHAGQNSSRAMQTLSPSSVLLTSAGLVSKSISNFLSPSPQGQPTRESPNSPAHENPQPDNNEVKLKSCYKNLREVFPNLDKEILKDIAFLNKGEIESSIDACLQIVAET
ncbi:uncharacterized protein PRCAT00003272001 [Priceomyces carsonii]|uniref:uncharacterized protein n=1 Tax=Priceomyces carsonii TaxID=28549 RepID=UPI002ED99472|nr:unnamed protein product [Priceomyces carsonii]